MADAKQDSKGPAPVKATEAKPKKQRTVLTDEQRLAKMEADLKAARERVAAKANKQANVLKEQRAKLVAKRDELNTKISKLDAEIEAATPASDTDSETTES